MLSARATARQLTAHNSTRISSSVAVRRSMCVALQVIPVFYVMFTLWSIMGGIVLCVVPADAQHPRLRANL